MKGARDRRPGGESGERGAGAPDQDTKKISASQLAEVLARVDGTPEPKAASPAEPRRTISGTRPIIRPVIRRTPTPPTGVEASPESAGAIDIPDGPLAAIIERPVDEGHVVNATTPLTPPREAARLAPAVETTSAVEDETAGALPTPAAGRSSLLTAIALFSVLAAAGVLVVAYWR